MSKTHPARAMLDRLDDADLELVAELVMQSGSLKGLAQAYGVSYPTIRSRLDRLIERVCDAMAALMAEQQPDPLGDLVAGLARKGELSAPGARSLRDAIEKDRAARALSAPRPTG